jgi:hypothetical protein
VIAALRAGWDNFRGSGAAALTVPPMDGAFRPNMAIENAPIALAIEDPNNLTIAGDTVYFSSGGQVLRLLRGRTEVVVSYAAPITAMAGAPDGTLAVASRSKGIALIDAGGTEFGSLSPDCGRGDVTAMAFVGEGRLALAVGSEVNPADRWRLDFMQRQRAGAVWLFDLSNGEARKIAAGLAYPYGVAADNCGGLLVSEAWASRLTRVSASGGLATATDNLPAYPCRLSSAVNGGFWLALFAPRNQLVEHVLRETIFRERMIREIASEYWVSPSLVPHESALSPMQEGGQKVGGATKPWAPSFSYGLIARLDRNFQPQTSLHSRANGRRHGITSVVETNGRLLATSKGADVIVDIAL